MASRAIHPRSTCAVPGCASWSRCFPGQWLCARHWRMVRRSRRSALRRAWRIIDAHLEAQGNGSPVRVDARGAFHKARRFDRLVWAAAVREATLRAAGL